MQWVRLTVLLGVAAGVATAQQPTVSEGGVLNSASYSTANPPGSLITIFGTNMAKAGELLIASSTPLTMQLQNKTENVSVTVNDKAAPVYYVTATQSSVQLPWGTKVPASGTDNATIVVTRNGVKSPPQQMKVGRYSPGIFTVNQQGTGMAWVINNNDGTVAQPSAGWPFPKIATRAAKEGDNLFIYVTGLGPVNPTPKDGAAPCPAAGCPAGVKLAKTTTNPKIIIAGTAIPGDHIQFSGLTPFYPGVYQLNFQMPSGIPAGNATTLEVQIGGVTSNQVTFATQ
jgi:uncharacterized protein (TIGR03437 family)